MAEPFRMDTINMDVSFKQKLDGNVMTISAGTGIMIDGWNMKGMDGFGAGGWGLSPSSPLLSPSSSSSLSSSSSSSSLASSSLSYATSNWEMALFSYRAHKKGRNGINGDGEVSKDKGFRKEGTVGDNSKRKAMERKEKERKEKERKEKERKEKERKEMDRKVLDRKEMIRKELEKKMVELKDLEAHAKMLDWLKLDGCRYVHPENEIRKVEEGIKIVRREIEGMKREGMEMERKEMEKKEMERSEMRGKELEREEIERKEMERNGKEFGKKEISEVLDREGKKKEGSDNVGRKRRRIRKRKESDREDTMDVLRRRNIELVAQLREIMEENALLHERIRKKIPGKSFSPRMRKVVKETVLDGAYEDLDGPVDLPREEELPSVPPLPPLPPEGGGMQDGSKKKKVETSAVSESKVADWSVVARRSWRGGRVEDVLSSSLPPPGSPRKRELLVVGLEESAAPCKVMEALCGIGSCPKEDIRMGPIRIRSGSGMVWVQLPVAAALKAAKEGNVRVGRTTARVELLRVRPLQCFKCWSFGHAQNACRSMANRWRACYRCGQNGHMARDCDNPVHCVVCYDAGMNAHHRLGGPLCSELKRQGKMVEGSTLPFG